MVADQRTATALAHLRHAYHQLVLGVVADHTQFADGLIAPAIRALESIEQEPVDEVLNIPETSTASSCHCREVTIPAGRLARNIASGRHMRDRCDLKAAAPRLATPTGKTTRDVQGGDDSGGIDVVPGRECKDVPVTVVRPPSLEPPVAQEPLSIEAYIALWSMRPQPGTPLGEAWVAGALWAATHWAPQFYRAAPVAQEPVRKAFAFDALVASGLVTQEKADAALALYPGPSLEAPLTDERIIEIRDSLLPSQGESFDCIAFARALLEAHNAG